MQTQEAIEKRRSVREFLKKGIPIQDLEKIIEAARLAPTARNEQPWEFVVITDDQIKREVASATGDNGAFIAGSSACIAVFCRDTKYYLEDGCAATENILLRATDLGISSCWVAGDKKPYCQSIKKLLKAAENYKLISLLALGYPKEGLETAPKPKRALKELLHWQSY